ncbi:hypothetical protein HHK36_032558 [Tetracentron sinense]|uniref:Uncharacterized protein n=1 Tax=Tetracentron sinense TaxID=13715 RepID=A0A834Y7X3_TETSI|nr:hypothetical protein HHK36_032558 [Tetracentron sinense]
MEGNGPVSGENERRYSISIEMLANSIRENWNPELSLSSETCIYRVPEILRKGRESAYAPKLVSLGPFHRDNQSLCKMNVHKRRYLNTYLEQYPEINLESCLETLSGLEQRARQCYAEDIHLNSNQFLEMMLLDGFFIIVFLQKFYSFGREDNDPILNTMWMPSLIQVDLILLENQLPFFVLEHLFNLMPVSDKDYTYPNLVDLTIDFFYGFVRRDTPSTIVINSSGVRHILDLFRTCCIPSSRSEYGFNFRPIPRHSVTELHEVGVKFKAGDSESGCLMDVKFTGKVLEVQPLLIRDGTEPFFRNLIALEQCHYPTKAYVNSYAAFMNSLINTPKDVDLLVNREIILNYLSNNEEVSHFINNLSADDIIYDESYFSEEYAMLDAYCKKRLHKWMTSLRRYYFHSSWAVIPFIASVILLILTLIQSVCSIISL